MGFPLELQLYLVGVGSEPVAGSAVGWMVSKLITRGLGGHPDLVSRWMGTSSVSHSVRWPITRCMMGVAPTWSGGELLSDHWMGPCMSQTGPGPSLTGAETEFQGYLRFHNQD